MPKESPDESNFRATQLTAAIKSNLESCEDLSELVQFVASCLGDRIDTPNTMLTDVECSARVWRGVERIHQEIYQHLLFAQEGTTKLHDLGRKDGAR